MTSYQGINLLDVKFLAYAQWVVSHADKLPALQEAGKALISETSTIKQRAQAAHAVLGILVTMMDNAPDKIFGAGEDAHESAFMEIGAVAEEKGMNVLLLIQIISMVMSFLNRK